MFYYMLLSGFCFSVCIQEINFYPTGGVEGDVRYSPDTHIYQSGDITSAVFGMPDPNGTNTPPNTPQGALFRFPETQCILY